jgi:hypothetical protein
VSLAATVASMRGPNAGLLKRLVAGMKPQWHSPVGYAADHADEVRAWIERNRAMAERSQRTSEQREAPLA